MALLTLLTLSIKKVVKDLGIQDLLEALHTEWMKWGLLKLYRERMDGILY